jgi:hypothetical protein
MQNNMALINIFLTDLHVSGYSAVVIEVAKVLLVSVGWIGGLTAFVYWKDKYKTTANVLG